MYIYCYCWHWYWRYVVVLHCMSWIVLMYWIVCCTALMFMHLCCAIFGNPYVTLFVIHTTHVICAVHILGVMPESYMLICCALGLLLILIGHNLGVLCTTLSGKKFGREQIWVRVWWLRFNFKLSLSAHPPTRVYNRLSDNSEPEHQAMACAPKVFHSPQPLQ